MNTCKKLMLSVFGRPWKPESKFVSSASGSHFISAFTMAAYYRKQGGLL